VVGGRRGGTALMSDPTPLGDLLRSLMSRMGVASPAVWERIQRDWEQLAGSPWDRQSRPVSLQNGVLVVEAVATPAVAILRYGVTSLVQRLAGGLGPGVVTEVKVRPPSRSG
jgi:predicted nucleic acid-binding Zn ribbon protein